jgi:hypothetical protein
MMEEGICHGDKEKVIPDPYNEGRRFPIRNRDFILEVFHEEGKKEQGFHTQIIVKN